MLAISQFLDRINRLVGQSIAWLTVAMVLVTFLIVVMRYAFNEGSIALQESVIYMHAMVFMLGAAITLQNNEHVRVDIFYRKLGERGKAVINILGILFLLLPLLGFIALSSWDYVAESWRLKESSREAGGLPWIYLLKTLILLLVATLGLQAISELLKNLAQLRNPDSKNT